MAHPRLHEANTAVRARLVCPRIRSILPPKYATESACVRSAVPAGIATEQIGDLRCLCHGHACATRLPTRRQRAISFGAARADERFHSSTPTFALPVEPVSLCAAQRSELIAIVRTPVAATVYRPFPSTSWSRHRLAADNSISSSLREDDWRTKSKIRARLLREIAITTVSNSAPNAIDASASIRQTRVSHGALYHIFYAMRNSATPER
jgi:hypothetical protein